MGPEEKKRIEDWISGRMAIETDGPDVIVRVSPNPGDPTPTGEYIPDRSIRIRFSEEEILYLAKIGRHRGPILAGLWKGAKKGLRVAGQVLVLGIVGAGAAAALGAAAPLALAGAGISAAALGIAPVLASEKAIKVAPGKDYKGLQAVLVLLGKLIVEVVNYLKNRKGK